MKEQIAKDLEESKRKRTRHGQHGSALYQVWEGMNARCGNPNHLRYKYYGGKGVKVCDEWRAFTFFMEWARKNGFAKGLHLDRIDSNGDYEPSNCRFITPKLNAQLREYNKLSQEKADIVRRLYLRGTWTRLDLAAEFSVHKSTIDRVLANQAWS